MLSLSTNRIFRDEVLNPNFFNSVDQAQEATDDRGQEYNESSPLECFGDMTMIGFIARKFNK